MNRTVLQAGEALRLTLQVEEARFGLTADDLFQTALRNNPERAFLFVSKVLGKHLPIRPGVLLAAGRLLALALEDQPDAGFWTDVLRGKDPTSFPALVERLEKERFRLKPEDSTLFTGFAETATGLARAVSACFDGACGYLSTTRLPMEGRESITFQESHSHAKTHLLYLDSAQKFLPDCQRAVIIDDEFTTGRTALRLVEALHQRLGLRRFVLLSLLDWGEDSPRRALAERLGVEIQSVSLLRGRIQEVRTDPFTPKLPEDIRQTSGLALQPRTLSQDVHLNMGRLFLSPEDQERSVQSCRAAAERLGPAGPDTLVLGSGELIYEPALIAGYLGASCFHSTTQSPIYPLEGSAITCGVRFTPPDCYSAAGYLYNVPPDRYSRALLAAEAAAVNLEGLEQLARWLFDRGCRRTEVVLL